MSKKFWFWAKLVEITVPRKTRSSLDVLGEVWVNLVLVSARDEREAVRKFLKLGRSKEGDCNASLTLHGKPATTRFVGIESAGLLHDGLGDGVEILSQIKRSTLRKIRKSVKRPNQLNLSLRREIQPYKRIGWVPSP
jgi:hypothetical protein